LYPILWKVPAYQDYEIHVENCCYRPIFDVTVERASFLLQAAAQVKVLSDKRISVLKPDEAETFQLHVVDDQDSSVFQITRDDHGNEQYAEARSPEPGARSPEPGGHLSFDPIPRC
jgi:hypothetical protein